MSDNEFMNNCKALWRLTQDRAELMKKVETEYQRRFGAHPSDIDDDFWIDTFHLPGSKIPTLQEIEENAELHK